MNLGRGITPQIQTLLLFTMLVEEYQVRVVARDEIELQPLISVSMSRLFYEAPYFR